MLAHFGPRFPDLAELERALHEVPRAAFHGRGEFVLALELGHVQLLELRLGIERIDVARPTFHCQKDARLRLGGNLLRLRREHTRARLVLVQQRRKRHRPQALIEKAAPRELISRHR